MYASYELILLTRKGRRLDVSPELEEDILIVLTLLTGYQLVGYPGTRWEVLKWPDYVRHMTMISKCFEDLVFLLVREGEKPGDLKREYFYRGIHFSDAARIEFKEQSKSVKDLVNSHDEQSVNGEHVNEFEKQSELTSVSVTSHESEELQFVTG